MAIAGTYIVTKSFLVFMLFIYYFFLSLLHLKANGGMCGCSVTVVVRGGESCKRNEHCVGRGIATVGKKGDWMRDTIQGL